jgi:hypothetical protein
MFEPVLFALAVLGIAMVPGFASADWPLFGRAISLAPGDQIGSVVCSDGAGGAIVAWHDRRQFPFNIDAQHVLASGAVDAAWPVNGRALLPVPLIQTIVPQGVEFPVIVSDGAGGAIVTWPDARNAVNGLDLFAQHVLASGAVDPAWPVNGTAVVSVSRDQLSAAIVSDGAGGAFIAWSDQRAGASADDRDIYAQHLLASGQVDPAWPANGTAVCTALKAQIGPTLVRDGADGVIIAWSDLRSGNPGIDIFGEHVSGSGVVDPAWPVNGLGLCTAPGTQVAPSIVSDGGAGAFVSWNDNRDGTNQIFALRVLSSGALATGWPVNGLRVSVGGIDEGSPVLVSDGASGAIVAWTGGGSGHHNSRAQHLLSSGVTDPAWPVGGIAVGTANSEQTNQVIASDGAGGANVAWQQVDGISSFDVFAQHVLASGALDAALPAAGRVVVDLPGEQHEPDIVATGDGGAIVAWMDSRGGSEDIFALQLKTTDIAGVPGPAPSNGVAFAGPRPNPASGSAALRLSLPRTASVRLGIYDIAGHRVRELVSGSMAAGDHAIPWDLRDSAGHSVGAGIYFARLEVEGRTLSAKVATMQ